MSGFWNYAGPIAVGWIIGGYIRTYRPGFKVWLSEQWNKPRTQRAKLQALCGAMYQAAGAYDMPLQVLDILAKAKNGDDITMAEVESILPCDPPAYLVEDARYQQSCKF